MICPNCNRNYKDGTVLCPKCHVTLRQNESLTTDNKEANSEEDLNLELVFQTCDSYEFIAACKELKDRGVEFRVDECYSGELRVDGQGRGQAPFVWNIWVPIEQKENALTLLSGRMAANAGYANARMEPIRPEQRKIIWITTVIVVLIWAIIIWKLNF